jgi:catechol 2,3-dioxygenase-like lactoylglutathione lyase family enzyme
MLPALTLVVLRSADLAATRRFYEALGLTFTTEQHGTGPLHHACVLGETVLEIYPRNEESAPDRHDDTRLGLRVADLEAAVAAVVAAGGTVHRRPSAASHRAIVGDPDGRFVELTT